MPAIATDYRSVVCPSVTLVHPAKAVGRNDMPCDIVTGTLSLVWPKLLCYMKGPRFPHSKAKARFWDRNLQSKRALQIAAKPECLQQSADSL